MGNPCTICGCWSSKHRKRQPRNRDYDRQYNRDHPRVNPSARIIGVDGEGQGRRPHQYNYLAAADEFGTGKWSCVPAGERLTSQECLDFLCDLPRRALVFGYAFLYDLTKVLQDLPNRTLYRLFHEETRAVAVKSTNGKWRITYRPVAWKHYRLNFMNRRFTVERHRPDCASLELTITRRPRCDCMHVRRVTVWDIFRFFGESFIQSLLKWSVADKARLEQMAAMKERRGQAGWNELPAQTIRDYCNEECVYLAKLGRSLIDAHDEADLHLTQYYGAGSTASALLKKMDVLRFRGEFPIRMRKALACAFFGGRFENSVVGPVAGPVWNYDISSAYPYQATLLPCLACGVWEYVPEGKTLERRIKVSRLALIKWCIVRIQKYRQDTSAWGVFPVRAPDGTIAFPISGAGGWTWKDEFLTGRRFNPHVEAKGAWVYDNDCEHKPFGSLPETYRERVRWGKDAKGIVLKLGPNSVYGKVAQSRGLNPPFQSWIWAGNITSGTRAQLLESLRCAKDPWNVLMFATDGVWSREPLQLPKPLDTGTGDLAKPLGGWEEKSFGRGVFAVRPGIYFPLEPTETELKEVRARGLGKRVLYDKWREIVAAYEAKAPSVELAGIDRFVGAKSAISVSQAGKSYKRSKNYGEWIDHKIKVSFKPAPKRRSVMADGRLEAWPYLPESIPYKKSFLSFEKLSLLEAEQIAEEQPDADFTYEDKDA
jgi:DNA polymerase type B, organellar and viral